MSLTGSKIASKYMVGPKIGSGSFGEVYAVNQIGTSEICALKKEDEKNKYSQLPMQAKIIKSLNGCQGFPKIYWQGLEGKSNMLIIDMLGPSLEDLFQLCDKKFSIKTTAMLADQMIERIEQLHSKNFVHRDIKPENFLMGIKGQSHIVHLIDFGLSKKYRDHKTHQHIPYKQNKSLTGTARYASINAHLGIEQSRRDDLEAIGYVLLYFIQGYLPWQGIKANNKTEKYQKIMQKKMSIPIEIQCDGLPVQFATYLNYCRSLRFEDKPDYTFLRKLFRQLMQHQKLVYDFAYDWCECKEDKNYSNGKIKIDLRAQQEQAEKIDDYLDEIIQKQEEEDKENIEKNNLLKSRKSNLLLESKSNFKSSMNGEENIHDSNQLEEFSSNEDLGVRDIGEEIEHEDKRNKMIFDQY